MRHKLELTANDLREAIRMWTKINHGISFSDEGNLEFNIGPGVIEPNSYIASWAYDTETLYLDDEDDGEADYHQQIDDRLEELDEEDFYPKLMPLLRWEKRNSGWTGYYQFGMSIIYSYEYEISFKWIDALTCATRVKFMGPGGVSEDLFSMLIDSESFEKQIAEIKERCEKNLRERLEDD